MEARKSMDALTTITTNFMVLWNAPKDWSLSGGLIWLTGMCSIAVVMMIVAAVNENRSR